MAVMVYTRTGVSNSEVKYKAWHKLKVWKCIQLSAIQWDTLMVEALYPPECNTAKKATYFEPAGTARWELNYKRIF